MIGKMLGPVLDKAGKAVVQGASALGKAVVGHFSKHISTYLIGGGAAAAAAGAAYVVGKSAGHSKGKKEGEIEQAIRDKRKLEEMSQRHEEDRKRWSEQKQAYEDLLNDVENNR